MELTQNSILIIVVILIAVGLGYQKYNENKDVNHEYLMENRGPIVLGCALLGGMYYYFTRLIKDAIQMPMFTSGGDVLDEGTFYE